MACWRWIIRLLRACSPSAVLHLSDLGEPESNDIARLNHNVAGPLLTGGPTTVVSRLAIALRPPMASAMSALLHDPCGSKKVAMLVFQPDGQAVGNPIERLAKHHGVFHVFYVLYIVKFIFVYFRVLELQLVIFVPQILLLFVMSGFALQHRSVISSGAATACSATCRVGCHGAYHQHE